MTATAGGLKWTAPIKQGKSICLSFCWTVPKKSFTAKAGGWIPMILCRQTPVVAGVIIMSKKIFNAQVQDTITLTKKPICG